MRRCMVIVTEHQRTRRRCKILCLTCVRKNCHSLVYNLFLPQSDLLLHLRYRFRGFLLYLITLNEARTLAHAHTYTHTEGLLLTSDQPEAETSTWKHIIQETDIHAPSGIRTRNTRKPAAVDARLIPHGHWDRRLRQFIIYKCRGLKESEVRFTPKGRFTHRMLFPCRAHAVSLPCRALIHTCYAAPLPCSDSAMSFVNVCMVAGNIRLLVQQCNRSSFL